MATNDELDYFTAFLDGVNEDPSIVALMSILKERKQPVHIGEIVEQLAGQYDPDQIIDNVMVLKDAGYLSHEDDTLFELTSSGQQALAKATED